MTNDTNTSSAREAGAVGGYSAGRLRDYADANECTLSCSCGDCSQCAASYLTPNEAIDIARVIDTLRAQLEAAEAEVTRLSGINSDLCRVHNARLADTAQLEARAEAAEADADRYRWLRQDASFEGWKLPESPVACPDNIAGCRYKHTREVSGAALDAAIDAARTKEAAP